MTNNVTFGFLGHIDVDRRACRQSERALYTAIIDDLVRTFGVPVRQRYGPSSQATTGTITVGEVQLEELMASVPSTIAKKSIATFVLAHEYSHVYLEHPNVVRGHPPVGFAIHAGGYRRILELQADYLAARYVRSRGLSVTPVAQMFEDPVRFRPAGAYPSGDERILTVRRAIESRFHAQLFANELLDCLKFLDSLTARLVDGAAPIDSPVA